VAEGDQREDGAAGHPVDGLLDQDLMPVHGNRGGATPLLPRTPPTDVNWGGAAPLLPQAPPTVTRASLLLENGFELELAAYRAVRLDDLEARHGVVVDVPVGVEAPLAVDPLEVLGEGYRLAEGLPLPGDVLGAIDLRRGALERVDRDPAAFHRVERVGGGLL